MMFKQNTNQIDDKVRNSLEKKNILKRTNLEKNGFKNKRLKYLIFSFF